MSERLCALLLRSLSSVLGPLFLILHTLRGHHFPPTCSLCSATLFIARLRHPLRLTPCFHFMAFLGQNTSNGILQNTCATSHPLIPHEHALSGWNEEFTCVCAILSFRCISCRGMCPCEHCAWICWRVTVPWPHPLFVHKYHCIAVLWLPPVLLFLDCEWLTHLPLSLFIARPFAGYHAIGSRPTRLMVLRLLGVTIKNILAKRRPPRTSMSCIRSHSLAGLRAQGPRAGVADL